ncbi:hypothetical protein F2Q69_00061153 [Brassica cretica]|uniref:Uncharacterized protein n=1 Tax=Brassica cretica TaxID=69181 RepID=A0A8S9RCN4_BRACR|nr:hypothetical protein F2Q69_00061153 [Brassica cretica]
MYSRRSWISSGFYQPCEPVGVGCGGSEPDSRPVLPALPNRDPSLDINDQSDPLEIASFVAPGGRWKVLRGRLCAWRDCFVRVLT